METKSQTRNVRLPPTFQQVCVLAREQINSDSSIDDGEWKARIKDRLAHLGFAYPQQQDAIEKAMRAVEISLTKYGTPRPAPAAPRSRMAAKTLRQQDPPWRAPRTTAGGGLTSLTAIIKSLFNSTTSGT